MSDVLVYCVLRTVYCVLCTVCCVLCTVYCILHTVYCVLCTVYCILRTVYCVLHTVCCVLCTVYSLYTTGVWCTADVRPGIHPALRSCIGAAYRRCGPLTGAVRGAVPVLSARRAQPARDAVVGACVRATRVGHSNRTLAGSACHVSTEALQNTADRGVSWGATVPLCSHRIPVKSPLSHRAFYLRLSNMGSEDYSSVLKWFFCLGVRVENSSPDKIVRVEILFHFGPMKFAK